MEKEKFVIDLTDAIHIARIIEDYQSGLYGSENEKGEELAITIEKGVEMEITVFQRNGWVRVDTYSQSGLKTDEIFSGKWN